MASSKKLSIWLGDITRYLFSSFVLGLMVFMGMSLYVFFFIDEVQAAEFDQVASRSTRIEDVQSGSLLLNQEDGQHVRAPALNTEAAIQVNGMVARAVVKQRFQNMAKQWVEGTYIFPLAEQAAVDHLLIKIGDRTIEGQIHEKKQAKQIYTQAKAAGQSAALLDQNRPNLFMTSVANIAPGEEIEIELSYFQTITYKDEYYRLRFPMVVGPRYSPSGNKQTLLRTKASDHETITDDASEETKDEDTEAHIRWPVTSKSSHNPVSLTITLDPGFPLQMLQSTYHDVKQRRDQNHRYHISLQKTTPANRDFELVWRPRLAAQAQIAAFSEVMHDDHYTQLILMPPKSTTEGYPILNRELTFVIDTSGSMYGDSIEQAKQALRVALSRLKSSDYFNIIQFNSFTDQLFDRPQEMSPESKSAALQYIKGLQADGGTEILPAVKMALAAPENSERLQQIVFLTDASVDNELALFRYIQANLGAARLFTIGIGSAPNAYFLRKSAQYGRGSYTFVGNTNEVQEKVTALMEKLERPALTDLHLDGIDHVEMWPQKIPDLYHGDPVILHLKSKEMPSQLQLAGKRGRSPWQLTLNIQNHLNSDAQGVAKLWARDKIAALMDGLTEGVAEEQIRPAVVKVALQHRLLSRYTSLVAVDLTPRRSSTENLHGKKVPTNLPQGWNYAKVLGALPQTATSAQWRILVGCCLLVCALLYLTWIHRVRYHAI